MARWTAADLFDPSGLPEPTALLRRHLALVLAGEGLDGQGLFRWLDEAPNGPLASWEDGAGDHYFARVLPRRAVVWGLNHESVMSPWMLDDEDADWPGMTAGLPVDLKAVLDAEPDRGVRHSVSFCFWHDGRGWHRTDPEVPDEERSAHADPQGAHDVLVHIADRDTADRYVDDVYGRPELLRPLRALIDAVESARPLTVSLVGPFAAATSSRALLARAQALGLPTA